MIDIKDVFYIASRDETVFVIDIKDLKDHKAGDTFKVGDVSHRISRIEITQKLLYPPLIGHAGIVVKGKHK